MNIKNPVILSLFGIIILTILGAILLTDWLQMVSMLVLGASLVVLVKFTIGKKASTPQATPTPTDQVTGM